MKNEHKCKFNLFIEALTGTKKQNHSVLDYHLLATYYYDKELVVLEEKFSICKDSKILTDLCSINFMCDDREFFLNIKDLRTKSTELSSFKIKKDDFYKIFESEAYAKELMEHLPINQEAKKTKLKV